MTDRHTHDRETPFPYGYVVFLSLSACLIGLALPFSRALGAALTVLWVVALIKVVADHE